MLEKDLIDKEKLLNKKLKHYNYLIQKYEQLVNDFTLMRSVWFLFFYFIITILTLFITTMFMRFW